MDFKIAEIANFKIWKSGDYSGYAADNGAASRVFQRVYRIQT